MFFAKFNGTFVKKHVKTVLGQCFLQKIATPSDLFSKSNRIRAGERPRHQPRSFLRFRPYRG